MKNHNRILSILSAAASALLISVLMTSCSDELSLFDRTPIQMSASSQVEFATRAGIDIQGSNFKGGQTVNVFIKDKETGESLVNTPYPVPCETSEPENGSNTLTPTPQPYYPSGSGVAVKMFAVYPPSIASDETVDFSVSSNQESDDDYMNSDLMWAKIDSKAKNSEVANFNFEHKMVKLIINATGESEDYTPTGITLKGVHRTIGFNPTDGSTDNLSTLTSDEETTINMSNGGAVLFPPQFIQVEGFITVHTSKGDAKFDLNMGKDFLAGKLYKMNLAIGADNMGSDNNVDIGTWKPEDGEVTVTPNGGENGLQISDIAPQVYTQSAIEPVPESVTYGTENKKTLYNETHYMLDYIDNVEVGTAQMLLTGIGYYAGIVKVKSFEITQAPGLLRFPKTTNVKIPFEIGKTICNDDEYSLQNIDERDKDLAENVRVADGSVAFSSDNTSVATVDSRSGIVTIVGTGSVTITATATDSRNYKYDDDAGHNTKVAEFPFEVTGRTFTDNSDIRIVLTGAPYIYDGTQHTPSVQVYDGNTQLKYGADKDYTYEYIGCIKANDGNVKITGYGNYTGSKTESFVINKNKATLTTEPSTSDITVGKITTNFTQTKTNTAATQTWAAGTLKYSLSSTEVDKPEAYLSILNPGDDGYSSPGIIKGIHPTVKNGTPFWITVNVRVEGTDDYDGTTSEESKTFRVRVVQADTVFAYTGSTQKWTCPASGTYTLSVSGAQGGSLTNVAGGKGATVNGDLDLTETTSVFYVNVGGAGSQVPIGTSKTTGGVGKYATYAGGWNGGGFLLWGMKWGQYSSEGAYTDGAETKTPICTGGGATDIALDGVDKSTDWNNTKHLMTRILVGGGGGGAFQYTEGGVEGTGQGGSGGGWNGGNGQSNDPGEGAFLDRPGKGTYTIASINSAVMARGYAQTKAYDGRGGGYGGSDGVLGEGGFYWCVPEGAGCGGGGWFGGGSAGQHNNNGSGAGGSSYAWCDLPATNSSGVSHNLYEYYDIFASLPDEPKYISNKTTKNAAANSSPKDKDFPKLTNVTVSPGVRNGNGTARITAKSLD